MKRIKTNHLLIYGLLMLGIGWLLGWGNALIVTVVEAGNFRHVRERTAPIVLQPGEVVYSLCANGNHTLTPGPEQNDLLIGCVGNTAVSGEGEAAQAPEDDHILLFPGQLKDIHCEGSHFVIETFGNDSLGAECIE